MSLQTVVRLTPAQLRFVERRGAVVGNRSAIHPSRVFVYRAGSAGEQRWLVDANGCALQTTYFAPGI